MCACGFGDLQCANVIVLLLLKCLLILAVLQEDARCWSRIQTSFELLLQGMQIPERNEISAASHVWPVVLPESTWFNVQLCIYHSSENPDFLMYFTAN